jgi:predicted DCC family thiol-disulfide oxidoreductase YuxK
VLRAHGREPPPGDPESVVLVEGGRVYDRSDAALRIARALGLPWSLAGLGLLLPRALRDGVYRFVARRRYRWFGREESCRVPTPALRARFLAS